MKQFRSRDGIDPEVYLAAIVSIMTHYPTAVLEQLCDPFFGLAGSTDWCTPKAVKDFCDKLMGPRWEGERRARRVQAQLDERTMEENRRREPRPSLVDIEDEMAARGFRMRGWLERNKASLDAKGEPHGETAATVQAKFYLTPKEWAELPDAPPAGSRYWQGGR